MPQRFDDWEGDYLKHFGVLGMKWGVRKDPQKAYEKAQGKLNKLKNRRTKAEIKRTASELKYKKALKKLTKIENKRVGPDDPGYHEYKKRSSSAYENGRKAEQKYQKANFSATKALYKEQKWTQNMLKAFGEMTYEELEKKYGKG